jgi:hypothetical protein
MSANYWIKLYIEILNDSKMAVLPDRLWRRTVELFAAAGHYNDKGNLPDTQQLAWLFRMNTDDLELDLKQIATTGIIQRTTTGWLVTKFEERQAPVSGNERVKQFRQRQQKQQYYGDVTELKRDVTQIQNRTDTDTDTEQRRGDTAAAISSFNAIDDHKAEILYMKITGLTFIQRKDLADVTNGMLSIMDDYKGKDGALIEDGKAMYSKWCNTVSEKTGKPYSKLNPGWLGWWIEAINNVPADLTQKDVKDMTSAEFAQYLERINQE